MLKKTDSILTKINSVFKQLQSSFIATPERVRFSTLPNQHTDLIHF